MLKTIFLVLCIAAIVFAEDTDQVGSEEADQDLQGAESFGYGYGRGYGGWGRGYGGWGRGYGGWRRRYGGWGHGYGGWGHGYGGWGYGGGYGHYYG